MNSLTVNQAQQWVSEEKAIIIDVREPAEIASCSIEAIIPAPLGFVSGGTLEKNDLKWPFFFERGNKG